MHLVLANIYFCTRDLFQKCHVLQTELLCRLKKFQIPVPNISLLCPGTFSLVKQKFSHFYHCYNILTPNTIFDYKCSDLIGIWKEHMWLKRTWCFFIACLLVWCSVWLFLLKTAILTSVIFSRVLKLRYYVGNTNSKNKMGD